MANSFTDLMQTLIMPLALPVLREACTLPMLINRDFDSQAAEQNQTIRVPLPQSLGAAADFDPATGSSSTDLGDNKVDVVLNKWKYKQFQMNDKEMFDSVSGGILPSAVQESIRALANAINQDLFSLYPEIYGHAGVAGTTPDDASDITASRKILNKQKAPNGDRRLVLDPEAEAAMLVAFKDADKTGTTQALRRASLGELFGFETFMDQDVPFHTAGTQGGETGLAVNGAVSAGATTMNADGAATATATLVVGDVFTVAGVEGQYVVTANITASSSAFTGIAFSPAAPAGGFPNDAAITVSDSHRVNLAFHRDFATLAMRPLSQSGQTTQSEASTIATATDPVSGIPLRLETWRDPKFATRYWRFDVLYGYKLLRPELACRLRG